MPLKIYTRTGDAGETSVIGGRVAKDDARVEACGAVDELNAWIGAAIAELARSEGVFADMVRDLLAIQHELFDCGADLARVAGDEQSHRIRPEMVERLEAWIDRYDAECAPIRRFVLPSGSAEAAALHVCRAVCRRAERRVVTLARQAEVNRWIGVYLNRLSDWLFVLARTANVRLGVPDVEYDRSGGPSPSTP